MRSGARLLKDIRTGYLEPRDLPRTLAELPGSPCRPSPRTRYNLTCHLSTSDVAKALQILGDDSRRERRPWASDDPELRKLRTGPHGPEFRAAVRRGGTDSGALPLSRFDAIGVVGAEQLARAAVFSARDLLRSAGPKADRGRLAMATGRDAIELHGWALLGELAELVVAAEVTSVPGDVDFIRQRGRALDLANLLALGGVLSAKGLADSVTAAAAKPAADKTACRSKGPAPAEAGGSEVDRVVDEPTPLAQEPVGDGTLADKLAQELSKLNVDETVITGIASEPAGSFTVPTERVLKWANLALALKESRVEAETAAAPPAGGSPTLDKDELNADGDGSEPPGE